MIFAKTADKVLAGEKTQTRRPTHYEDYLIFSELKIVRVKRRGRLLWEVDRTYAVQPGRTARSVGRIRLLSIIIERLYLITHEDARAEGFSGGDEFVRAWKELYPKSSLDEMVYVLEFELVKEE